MASSRTGCRGPRVQAWRIAWSSTFGLGYGAAGQVHKTINTVQCVLVETGSALFYDKQQLEIRAWTTDQGVERAVVGSANPLTVQPATIQSIRVEETIKEGKTVWQRGQAPRPN